MKNRRNIKSEMAYFYTVIKNMDKKIERIAQYFGIKNQEIKMTKLIEKFLKEDIMKYSLVQLKKKQEDKKFLLY